VKSSGIHLWLVLWKAYTSLRRQAEKSIEALGLSMSDFAVLEVLLHKGPLPVNTIGDKVMLTSGSISVAIDRLHRKRLVTRRNDPGDRRTRVVHLTPEGHNLIECAFALHAAAMEKATAGLSPAERDRAVDLLKRLGQTAAA
jgi:MarR family 2-MHQ and catechol resistance regulon transcriptional repressor